MTDRTCANCDYFLPNPLNEVGVNVFKGICRRNPLVGDGYQPRTAETDWCGAWKNDKMRAQREIEVQKKANEIDRQFYDALKSGMTE